MENLNEETNELFTEEKAVQEADSWLGQKTFNDVAEESYQRGSFTCHVIHAGADGKLFEGVGFAKARQELGIARYDSDRGIKVASGRAIHDLFMEYKRHKDAEKHK
jgi:hypothetical protein